MANEFKVKKGLIVIGSGSNILDIQGSQGQLFSVTDSLSGSLFSVNDISGLPILKVFSDDSIRLGTFNNEAIIVSGNTSKITGSLLSTNGVVSGSSQIGEIVRLQQTTASLNSTTGSLIGITNGLMAVTASFKAAEIVSSSTQIQNYNTFAVTSSANTFYGNQGISGSLNVTRATGTNVIPQLTVNNTTTNGYGIVRLVGAARGGIIDFYNTSSAQASIVANDGALQFYTNGDSTGTPTQTITATSNVLIGTTTDSGYKLDVAGTMYVNNTFAANSKFSSYNTDGLFNVNSRPCTITTPGGGQTIRFGYNDYGAGQYWGRIGFAATTNWSLGTIDSAGNNFSIGTDFRGIQLYMYTNGNYAFSGSNVSDSRKKANINYINSNQLENILKLKPASFNQKSSDGIINSNTHTGFIAQDVLEAGIDNLVHGSDEDGYGLDYYGVLALAVKAIQEQKIIIDGLLERIEALESN
jgi:hypothetical protein